MGKNNNNNSNSGCGCGGCLLSLIIMLIFYLVLASIWFGLPINGSKWNIDIFPPRIWDMNEAD
jgi:hypothetical protein